MGRRGKKKALVAVGHKIIVAAYHILSKGEKYKEPVLKPKPDKTVKKSIRNYLNKIEAMGMSQQELIEHFAKQNVVG